jgi:outer membrane protein TolC
MMGRSLLISLLFLALPAGLFAGYEELKKELDDYTPPPFRMEAEERPPRPLPEGESIFQSERRKIEAAGRRWETLLAADKAAGGPLLEPDPRLMKRVGGAEKDPEIAIEILADGFSVEELELLTLLRNPGIKAAESRLSAAIDAFGQVANLEEILRRYTAFTEGVMPGVGPMAGKEAVSMKFPFPGVLSLKGEVANRDAEIARLSLARTLRDAITRARKSYWDLVFIAKSIGITEETLELFRHLEMVATTRYETGRTSFQDVIKVGIRRETLEENLVTLRERYRNAELGILELLDLPPGIRPGAPETKGPAGGAPDLEALYRIADKERQELNILRARIGKIDRMIEMAETMVVPPYTLNLSLYGDRAILQTGTIAMEESFPVGVAAARGIGLPKNPWYGTNDPYLRQTRKKRDALAQELKAKEAETATLVRNGWYRLDLALREEILYGESIKEESRAALDVSTSGYEAGNVSFADVISSYSGWLDASLALEKRRSDIGIARAELMRIVGRSL